MAKVSHVVCSHHLVECEPDNDPTDEQITKQEGHIKFIICLRRSDEGWYTKLIDSLKIGSHLRKDEYPINVSGMYALLSMTSGEFDRNKKI